MGKAYTLKETEKSNTFALIARYWQEIRDLTGELKVDDRFSTPLLVSYINTHLPSGCEPVTKIKIDYLHNQGVLKPERIGSGEHRKSWRYTSKDMRRVLLAEILKARENMSVQEIKGRIQS